MLYRILFVIAVMVGFLPLSTEVVAQEPQLQFTSGDMTEQWFVFSAGYTGEDKDIFIVNRYTGKVVQRIGTEGRDIYPSFSSNGEILSFLSCGKPVTEHSRDCLVNFVDTVSGEFLAPPSVSNLCVSGDETEVTHYTDAPIRWLGNEAILISYCGNDFRIYDPRLGGSGISTTNYERLAYDAIPLVDRFLYTHSGRLFLTDQTDPIFETKAMIWSMVVSYGTRIVVTSDQEEFHLPGLYFLDQRGEDFVFTLIFHETGSTQMNVEFGEDRILFASDHLDEQFQMFSMNPAYNFEPICLTCELTPDDLIYQIRVTPSTDSSLHSELSVLGVTRI
jgi:hypothetical protein